MILRLAVLVEHQLVSDRQTDTRRQHIPRYTLCLKKNVLTLKRYSSKLQGAILMKFGRNIQNTLE